MHHLVNRTAIQLLSQNHRIRDKMLHACAPWGATCTAKQGRIVDAKLYFWTAFQFFFIQMGPGPTHPLPNNFWIFGIFLTLQNPLVTFETRQYPTCLSRTVHFGRRKFRPLNCTISCYYVARKVGRKVGTNANSALIRYYLPRLKLSSSTLALARERTPSYVKDNIKMDEKQLVQVGSFGFSGAIIPALVSLYDEARASTGLTAARMAKSKLP